jgi:hypothetical protein
MLMVNGSLQASRDCRPGHPYSRPMAQKATVCKAMLQIADIDRAFTPIMQ